MPIHDLIPSFNAGEVSPLIDARTSLEKYKSSCRTLENFIIMPYGGVNRRPGTEFVYEVNKSPIYVQVIEKQDFYTNDLADSETQTTPRVLAIMIDGRLSVGDKITISGTTYLIHEFSFGPWYVLADSTTGVPIAFNATLPAVPFNATIATGTKARVIPFNYSTTTRFVFVFSNHCLQIFSGGSIPTLEFVFTEVFSTVANAYVGIFPYSDNDLSEIQILQINDVVYISHPRHPLGKLTRLTQGAWGFDFVLYAFPPTLEENTTAVTLTPSGTTTTTPGSTISLTASAGGRSGKPSWRAWPFFNQADIGSFWTIAHRRDSANISQVLSANGTTGLIQVVGNWELTTSGTWTGNIFLERSDNNGGTWQTIRTWNSSADRNYTSSGTQDYPALLRIRYVGSGTGRALLEVIESKHVGVVKITSLTNDRVARAIVIVPLFAATATAAWSEAAFSDYVGQPSAMGLHEQRLFLSGNNSRAMSIWGSQVDNFDNFRIGTLDDDGIFMTLASGQQNQIEWMASQDQLIIGTNGDEWTIGGSDSSKTMSATNVRAANQSRYGSSNVQAQLLAEAILFVQRNGRKVRELSYSFEKDGWIATDLTLLAEHISRSGIKEVAYQQQPDNILWCIRNDGTLIGMTYERDQQVVGWHRHTTDGTFQSVGVIHGNGTEDEVWFVVKRTISGVDRLYVERFSLNWRDYLDTESSGNWRYLDCHSSITTPTNIATQGSFSIEPTQGIWVNNSGLNLRTGDYVTFSGFTGTGNTLINGLTFEIRLQDAASKQFWLHDPVTGAMLTNATTVSITTSGFVMVANYLWWLNGKSVTAFYTSTATQSLSVVNKLPSTSLTGSPAIIGLPYTSTLQPMRLNIDLQDGTSQGRKARIHGMIARLYKSRGGQAMTNGGSWYDLGDATGVFTGDRKITLAGGYDNTADLSLRQTQPFPLTVIAIIPKWDTFGAE